MPTSTAQLLEWLTIAKPYIIMALVVAVWPLVSGYIVLTERKIMADMQVRLGPMRVGPHGLLQPLADALKLLIKEDIIPDQVDKWVFWLAPVIPVLTALTAFAVLPFSHRYFVADLNVGLIFILAMTSIGVLGIMLGGWASNSHYPLLGALRSTAQLVSYEVAMGFTLVSAVMVAGSLSMVEIVKHQQASGVWFVFYQPVGFFIYLVAAMAETNRAPFDMPEAESELVAGFMTEYSGFRWALYFLAEYSNIFVVCSIATTVFFGGWLRPFSGVHWLNFLDWAPAVIVIGIGAGCIYLARRLDGANKIGMLVLGGLIALIGLAFAIPIVIDYISGPFWFLFKVAAIIYMFMWVRFTFPRYRYDQLMKLGWKWMIPLGMANLLVTGVLILTKMHFWGAK
jgi:NADH-quinone oxidoreductase subunit H